MGLVEAAQVLEDDGAPHEHASSQATVRGLHRPVQHSQPLPAAARPCEGEPEGSLHVGLTLGLAGRAGQPHPRPQLGDGSGEVPAVAQDDADRLVSQRGVVGAGLTGQHGPRGEQGVPRPGQGQRQEAGRVGLRVSPPSHVNDAKQFSVRINCERGRPCRLTIVSRERGFKHRPG